MKNIKDIVTVDIQEEKKADSRIDRKVFFKNVKKGLVKDNSKYDHSKELNLFTGDETLESPHELDILIDFLEHPYALRNLELLKQLCDREIFHFQAWEALREALYQEEKISGEIRSLDKNSVLNIEIYNKNKQLDKIDEEIKYYSDAIISLEQTIPKLHRNLTDQVKYFQKNDNPHQQEHEKNNN